MKKGFRVCKQKDCSNVFEKNPNKAIDYCCSPDCYYKHSMNLLKKQGKDEEKQWRKEKKVRKDQLKTLGQYEKEARQVYQKFIRLRDVNEPCISCGCTTAKQWDGGHYFKAELYTAYIFEEPLCNKQCSRCNDLYSGNEISYRIGLVKKIGEEMVKAYEGNMNNARFYKFTKQELIEKKEYYKNKIKELKISG
jgi:hypothetical protein